MKKIFYLLFVFAILSCTPKVLQTNDVYYGTSMVRSMNGNYSIGQFDSMCIADTLPVFLSEWESIYLKDFETSENICIYTITRKNNTYKVEKINDDSVKIIKRSIIK